MAHLRRRPSNLGIPQLPRTQARHHFQLGRTPSPTAASVESLPPLPSHCHLLRSRCLQTLSCHLPACSGIAGLPTALHFTHRRQSDLGRGWRHLRRIPGPPSRSRPNGNIRPINFFGSITANLQLSCSHPIDRIGDARYRASPSQGSVLFPM